MLTLKQKLGYAAGDVGSCMISHPILGMFMFYCTNFQGIPIMAVTWLMFFIRFWDAINDLIIGALIDRTHTKRGKVHPWLGAYMIPTGICMWLMFALPKGLSLNLKIVWVSVAYTFYTWVFTGCNLGYGAILPLVTKDGKDRAMLATMRFAGVMVGASMVSILGQPIILLLGNTFFGGDRTYGYTVFTGIYACIGVAMFFLLYKWCPEEVYFEGLKEDMERLKLSEEETLKYRKEQEKKRGGGSFFKDISYLGRNGPWMIAFGIMLLTFILSGINPGMYLMIYYWKLDEALSSVFALVGMVPAILMMPFVPKIIGKWGYKGPLAVGMVVGIIRGVICFFLQDNYIAITVLGLITAPFGSCLGVAGIAMISDCLEYGDWKFDRRLEGIGTAAYSFSTKAGPAIGGIISGALLAWSKLDTSVPRGGDQAPFTIMVMRVMAYLLPICLTVPQLILTLLYPLNKEKYSQIVKEIAERNEARVKAGQGAAPAV